MKNPILSPVVADAMNLKVKWTPGPWQADENGVILGGLNGLTSIGETYYKAWERTPEHPMREAMLLEAQANGYLMAAAPELLEALQAMVANMEDAQETLDCDGQPFTDYAMAKEAIAKATNPNAREAQAYPAGRWTGGKS